MSAAQTFDRSGSTSFGIPDLVEMAETGILRVPGFQRSFIWTGADVRTLFDSIYRGFPIGTLLLWRTAADAGPVEFGPITKHADATTAAYWVVDGQQRITSLYLALSQQVTTDDPRFSVYFDLDTHRFVNAPRTVSGRAIPVREALETRLLIDWMRRNDDMLEPDDATVAQNLAGTLRDYRFSSYVVTGENRDLLREVFDRVNSAGKPMSRAQVFHALFASDKKTANPGAISEALRSEHFGLLDDGRIVQSLLAMRGGNIQRDIHGEFGEEEDPEDWYDKTEIALRKAIAFLRDQGVSHILLMPNNLPLPVLAAFFHLHPDPQPWTKRLLARWLWRGWVHGFGREGGQGPILRRAAQSVNPRTGDPAQAPEEYDAVETLLEFTPNRDIPRLPLTGFKTNSANGRLILLAMASVHPRRANGSPLELAQEFEQNGVNAVTELVPRNRGNAAVRSFLPEDQKLADLHDSKEAVLDSHLLSRGMVELAISRRYEEFAAERSSRLHPLVTSFLEIRLERNAHTHRSVEELIAQGSGAGYDGD